MNESAAEKDFIGSKLQSSFTAFFPCPWLRLRFIIVFVRLVRQFELLTMSPQD